MVCVATLVILIGVEELRAILSSLSGVSISVLLSETAGFRHKVRCSKFVSVGYEKERDILYCI